MHILFILSTLLILAECDSSSESSIVDKSSSHKTDGPDFTSSTTQSFEQDLMGTEKPAEKSSSQPPKNSTFPTTIRPTFPTGPNPKKAIISRFKLLVSDFLTDQQLSKSIDVAAVGIHRGTPVDKILDDIYYRLRRNMTTQQITDLSTANKGLHSSLDEKSIKVLKERIKRIIIHSLAPAVEQINKFAVRPSIAFSLMSETLNPRFVNSIKYLIRDIIGEEELEVLKKYYHPKIVKLHFDE